MEKKGRTVEIALLAMGLIGFLGWTLCLHPACAAQEPLKAQSEPLKAPAASTDKDIAGKIESVDSQKKTVMLQSNQFGAMEFTVNLNTIVTDGSKRLNLAELKRNDQVQIKYSDQNGKKVAESITVQKKG